MNLFKKISIVLLTAVFLFSGMGITIGSMICLKSGKGIVSFSMMEDCCKKKPVRPSSGTNDDCCNDGEAPAENILAFEKGRCCDINNYFIKLNDFNPSKKVVVEQPVLVNILFAEQAPSFDRTPSQKLSYLFTDPPPPYYGRALLNFISVLII